jgi:hypothetical protein
MSSLINCYVESFANDIALVCIKVGRADILSPRCIERIEAYKGGSLVAPSTIVKAI